MLLGVHVSIAGHIWESLDRAHALGCNTMQIFSRDPRAWKRAKIQPSDIEEFLIRRRKYRIGPVFIHVPYLINLASPRNILYNSSIRACVQDIRLAQALEADHLVVHTGSHTESGEKKGLRRVAEALNKIFSKTKDLPVGVLLENTAGSGSWLGWKFAQQQAIIEKVEQQHRLGICLDTCHAFAAGYDLSTPEGVASTLDEADALIGLEKLRMIHLNDSFDALNSRRDHHQHIGKGTIGPAGFKALINDGRLKNTAFILETPKDTPRADKLNLARVKKMRQE